MALECKQCGQRELCKQAVATVSNRRYDTFKSAKRYATGGGLGGRIAG